MTTSSHDDAIMWRHTLWRHEEFMFWRHNRWRHNWTLWRHIVVTRAFGIHGREAFPYHLRLDATRPLIRLGRVGESQVCGIYYAVVPHETDGNLRWLADEFPGALKRRDVRYKTKKAFGTPKQVDTDTLIKHQNKPTLFLLLSNEVWSNEELSKSLHWW